MYFIKQHFGKYFSEYQTNSNLNIMFNLNSNFLLFNFFKTKLYLL